MLVARHSAWWAKPWKHVRQILDPSLLSWHQLSALRIWRLCTTAQAGFPLYTTRQLELWKYIEISQLRNEVANPSKNLWEKHFSKDHNWKTNWVKIREAFPVHKMAERFIISKTSQRNLKLLHWRRIHTDGQTLTLRICIEKNDENCNLLQQKCIKVRKTCFGPTACVSTLLCCSEVQSPRYVTVWQMYGNIWYNWSQDCEDLLTV